MIGRTVPIKVEFDLIGATNRDLTQAVEEGRFREDLYYRIAGHVIRLPAVRERDDRADLIESIFLREARLLGRVEAALSREALALLATRPWHGNIREIRNISRLLISLDDDDLMLPSHVLQLTDGETGSETDGGRAPPESGPASRTTYDDSDSLRDGLSADAKRLIAVLRRNQWCISRAAREIGVNRVTIHRRMRRLGIVWPKYS